MESPYSTWGLPMTTIEGFFNDVAGLVILVAIQRKGIF
jgi:hypothetical protein